MIGLLCVYAPEARSELDNSGLYPVLYRATHSIHSTKSIPEAPMYDNNRLLDVLIVAAFPAICVAIYLLHAAYQNYQRRRGINYYRRLVGSNYKDRN